MGFFSVLGGVWIYAIAHIVPIAMARRARCWPVAITAIVGLLGFMAIVFVRPGSDAFAAGRSAMRIAAGGAFDGVLGMVGARIAFARAEEASREREEDLAFAGMGGMAQAIVGAITVLVGLGAYYLVGNPYG